MHRKAYCPKDSDFSHYYSSQSGSGFGDIRVVRAPRYQRGYGFGSFLGRLAMPVIKYIGREALTKGVTLGKKVVQDPSIQQAFKESVSDLATKSLSKIQQKIGQQRGSGRKKPVKKVPKRLYKKKKPTSKKAKTLRKKRSVKSVRKVNDIFNR